MVRWLPTACAAFALALATVTPSRADETWTGIASTDWFNAGNWAPTAVPTGADIVTIDTVTPNATVVGTAGATANGLKVGSSATGMLTIQNGGTVTTGIASGTIGFLSGSTGTVTVTGAGSSWTNSSLLPLSVGFLGTGTLTIQNGGTVSSGGDIGAFSGSTGTVTVTGAGSSWSTGSTLLNVGDSGTGTLTIQNGGTVSSGGANIGFNSGSTGAVVVTGAASSWTTNSGGLVVGGGGTGTLTIQNGGTVSSGGSGEIGLNSGTGTVTVTGVGSSWTISHSGLAIGVFDTGTLTIQDSGAVNVAGTVAIAQFSGSTGTLDIGAVSGQPAAAPGTLNAPSVAFGAGTGLIVFNHTASNYVFAPSISGAGSVMVEAGTTILTGTNTYTGGTTINAGSTLQLGNGGVGGSIVGNVADNGTLIFNRSDTFSFAGAVSGSGGLIQNGPGTTVLMAVSGYTGQTAVNAGTLEVDGSIANSSSVMVRAGATLSGTGAVGATTIMSGGTLAPGNASMPTGALTITGNLAFQSGALYLVGVNPASASAASVSGTASLAGNVLAAFAPGTYAVKQYDILHSVGLGGTTFAALGTTNLPNFAASLSYTSTDVFLNLSSQLGSRGGLNGNQQNVANSINNFFNGGGTLTPSFLSLFGLTGGNLANSLTLLSGEAAVDGEKGAFDLMTQFLGVMTDPRLGGPGSTAAMSFAAAPQADLQREADLPPEVALAYARALKAPPSPAGWGNWSVWGSGFGGTNKTGGDAVAGSHDVTARDSGFAGGADYRVSPDKVLGFALAGGDTHWDLAQGLGGGHSDAFQAGVYGRWYFGPAYVAGAAAFANHWMKTNRIAPLGDQLAASFNARVFGARLEAGERFALPAPASGLGRGFGVTPYTALQAQSFHTGAYSESDLSGGGFGLNYNAMNATDTRGELGARFDDLTMFSGMPLVLRGRLAWAHDWVSNPAIGAVFQALPGAAFTVNGAVLAKNSALTTAGFELRPAPNWSLGAKFEGELAARSQTYAGTGTLRYAW